MIVNYTRVCTGNSDSKLYESPCILHNYYKFLNIGHSWCTIIPSENLMTHT